MLLSVSKEEVIHEETEEQEKQDPVDWVDVDDDQTDVKQPAAHVGEVESIQREASVGEVQTSSGNRCPSLLSWSKTDKLTICIQSH